MWTQPITTPVNKQSFFLLFICSIIITSCGHARSEDDDIINSDISANTSFSPNDLAILNKVLKLRSSPFNYTNVKLPAHYNTEATDIADNTPANNPVTDMGATLGRVLFYDKALSIDNSISCASCHKQEAAFSDNDRFSLGLNGQLTRRNSMGLINSRYYENGRFMWDERAASLEEQVLIPIQDHKEMGLELAELSTKLQQRDYYQVLFRNTFGDSVVNADRVSKALAQFIRSIVSYESKFDKGLQQAGNPEVGEEMPDLPNFSAQENLGLDIFMRGRNGSTCSYCHGTAQNINDEAKNNGLALEYPDKGKGEITGNAEDNAVFKVPSLRNIANTAPYMHDGRFPTLMDVVNHYSDGVQQHPNLNFRLTTVDEPRSNGPAMKLNLNQEEKEALVAFLHTLTDNVILTDEKYSDPFK